MDGYTINKFVGWALFALLIIVGGNTLMNMAGGGHGDGHDESAAYKIEVAGEEGNSAKGNDSKGEDTASKAPDVKTLLASADPAKGAKVAKKCAACHSFDKGGKNKVGPALYNIVNRDLGSGEGFAYSGALKEKGGKWDYDALIAFLRKPKDFISGTKMAFAGIKKDDQLADLIAYLRSLSDNPAPLP